MDTVTAVLIAVHIVVSIALIALVLLNSGKGGGLSDMLGGPGASGNIGPILSAWSPPILAILLGISAIIYIEEG